MHIYFIWNIIVTQSLLIRINIVIYFHLIAPAAMCKFEPGMPVTWNTYSVLPDDVLDRACSIFYTPDIPKHTKLLTDVYSRMLSSSVIRFSACQLTDCVFVVVFSMSSARNKKSETWTLQFIMTQYSRLCLILIISSDL